MALHEKRMHACSGCGSGQQVGSVRAASGLTLASSRQLSGMGHIETDGAFQ